MRRSNSGSELLAGGRSPKGKGSCSLIRLPDERPTSASLALAGGAAVESAGSKPGSRCSSRPNSATRPSSGYASPGRLVDSSALLRLADEPGTPHHNAAAAAAALADVPTRKASNSRMAESAIASAGAGANSTLRDRMNMQLSIKTEKPQSVRERPKAFRRLKEGETVSKFYDFGDQIHDGGSRGQVLKAFRRSDNKQVVVKVRAKRSDVSSERAWRMVMTQLHGMRHQSAHVLDFFEILEDDNSFFVVMPMCEGGELFNFLVTEAEVPESECKRIIREILQAVSHLHDNSLIHRDIKPENILFDIDKDDQHSPKSVKLIDFDTCMEWTPSSPKSKRFVGTPGYIAPEALLGEASPQSDLWSVGVILYILMTGETPWTSIDSLEDGTVGSSGARKMYNSLKGAVIDWESDPWPDFPLARDLCQKLMAFDQAERLSTVSQALSHAWLAG